MKIVSRILLMAFIVAVIVDAAWIFLIPFAAGFITGLTISVSSFTAYNWGYIGARSTK